MLQARLEVHCCNVALQNADVAVTMPEIGEYASWIAHRKAAMDRKRISVQSKDRSKLADERIASSTEDAA